MKYIVDILPLNRSVVCIDSINEAPDDIIEEWNKTKTNAMTYVYKGDVYIVFNRADKTRSVANHKIGTQNKTLNSGIIFCWTTQDEIHNALEQINGKEKPCTKCSET